MYLNTLNYSADERTRLTLLLRKKIEGYNQNNYESNLKEQDDNNQDGNAKDQNAKEKNAKDKNAKDQNAKEKNSKDQNAKEKNSKDKNAKDQNEEEKNAKDQNEEESYYEYSIKKVQESRNSYFESYLKDPGSTDNYKTNQILKKMDVVYRICHSSNHELSELYQDLKKKIADLGFFKSNRKEENGSKTYKKLNENDIMNICQEIYNLYQLLDCNSDNIDIDFRTRILKHFPLEKLELDSEKIEDLFKVIESIDKKIQKILKTRLEINNDICSEYGVSDIDSTFFPTLDQPMKFHYFEEGPSSDDDNQTEERKRQPKLEKLSKENDKSKGEDKISEQSIQNQNLRFVGRKEEIFNFSLPSPAKILDQYHEENLVSVASFKHWVQKAFQRTKFLNPLQSKVKTTAFNSDENMLVCAPTGAGKTNIALMCILREIDRLLDKETLTLHPKKLKIVYIVPSSSQISEIVDKLSSRLSFLQIQVKGLTGATRSSTSDVLFAHIIVTTAEKWDLMTRKSDCLIRRLKLVIIDEMHFLNDKKGFALECIIARTWRIMEKYKLKIRLVGLSANVENPFDFADVLRIDENFVFNQPYRHIQVVGQLIGLQAKDKDDGEESSLTKKAKLKDKNIFQEVIYESVRKSMLEIKQVLVFVFSRKDAIECADQLVRNFYDKAENLILEGIKIDPLVYKFKNEDLRRLACRGVGFYNYGLLKQDRNLVEKLFATGALRILVTTPSFAWKVNLPAHSVVIKATNIYETGHGITDLSTLELEKMFGKAGKYLFDENAEVTVITTSNKMDYYKHWLLSDSPVESNLMFYLNEALNAEISLGTVNSIFEAEEWLKCTFLYIRQQKNPNLYRKDKECDDFLQKKLIEAIKNLNKLDLIKMHEDESSFGPTEIGRIISKHYVKCEIAHYCADLKNFEKEFSAKIPGNKFENKKLKDKEKEKKEPNPQENLIDPLEDKILSILIRAKEFENLTIREEEKVELNLLKKSLFLKIDDDDSNLNRNTDNTSSSLSNEKVFMLIQGYLLHAQFQTSSLISDTIYIIENSVRILRCMFEICLNMNMTHSAQRLLKWCKLFETKMKPNDYPLYQFAKSNNFSNYGSLRLKENGKRKYLSTVSIENLQEIFDFESIRNKENIPVEEWNIIKAYCSYIPLLNVEQNIEKLENKLKIQIKLICHLEWTPMWHLENEIFWVIIDDETNILHSEPISINQKEFLKKEKAPLNLSFDIPYQKNINKNYRLIIDSDRWIGCKYEKKIDLEKLEKSVQ